MNYVQHTNTLYDMILLRSNLSVAQMMTYSTNIVNLKEKLFSTRPKEHTGSDSSQ